MTEMTRKEKMAQEKAAWEAAQAAKKAAKLAKKEKPGARGAASDKSPGAETNDAQPENTPKPPKAEKAPKPPKAPKPAKTRKTRNSQNQGGVLQTADAHANEWQSPSEEAANVPVSPLPPVGLVVDLGDDSRPAKQARRARSRRDEPSPKGAGAKNSKKKKSVTYKTAVRMGLSEPVADMIEEKNRILALWKSRKITPELAVSNLSVLQARDPDGSVWRLLPRHGGYALVRTGHDGVPSIVEPPRKRQAWPAVVGGVLFSVLIVLALWGVVNPATDGEERIETPSSVVSDQSPDQATNPPQG